MASVVGRKMRESRERWPSGCKERPKEYGRRRIKVRLGEAIQCDS